MLSKGMCSHDLRHALWSPVPCMPAICVTPESAFSYADLTEIVHRNTVRVTAAALTCQCDGAPATHVFVFRHVHEHDPYNSQAAERSGAT
jgi:hypothetical protein